MPAPSMADASVVSYATARGETLLLQLPDGSRMQLAPLTDVHVAYVDSVRSVTLLGGEVYFQVAHDDARSFEVRVGPNVIQSVGTAFNVNDRPGEQSEVLVTEGRVVVSRHRDEALELSHEQALPLTSTAAPDARAVGPQEMRRRLAWREGWIVAEGETLSEIVARVNLFSPHRLIIDDPAIGGVRLGGAFNAVQAGAIVEAMGMLGIHGHIITTGGTQEIHLSGAGSAR